MQRQERVEGESLNFQMGIMPHGRFRVMWEDKPEDWEEAEIPLMDSDTLFRRYLSKLPLDLKNAAMSRSWPLDGEDNPHRKCKTWQDVADAVDMEFGHWLGHQSSACTSRLSVCSP